MSKSLKLDRATVLPITTIHTLRPITDAERTKMAETYGRSPDELARKTLSLQFADKSSRTAELTVDDVRAQGVALLNTGGERFIVASNVLYADPFTKTDADRIKQGGDITTDRTFRSRVTTVTGNLLSSATPKQTIEQAAKALASRLILIEDGRIVLASAIRSIEVLSDDDRNRMAEKYAKPASDFADRRVSLHFADKSSITTSVTLEGIRGQGIEVLDAGTGRFVIADNITRKVEPINPADIERLKKGGSQLSHQFRSAITTTAGQVWSTRSPAEINAERDRLSKGAGQGAVTPKKPAHG